MVGGLVQAFCVHKVCIVLYWALGVNSITLLIVGGTNQDFLSHKLEAVRDCIYNGSAFPIFGR